MGTDRGQQRVLWGACARVDKRAHKGACILACRRTCGAWPAKRDRLNRPINRGERALSWLAQVEWRHRQVRAAAHLLAARTAHEVRHDA